MLLDRRDDSPVLCREVYEEWSVAATEAEDTARCPRIGDIDRQYGITMAIPTKKSMRSHPCTPHATMVASPRATPHATMVAWGVRCTEPLTWQGWRDSNAHGQLRRLMLYPLSYSPIHMMDDTTIAPSCAWCDSTVGRYGARTCIAGVDRHALTTHWMSVVHCTRCCIG